MAINSVIIVGAGPAGLLLAVLLSQLQPRPHITILDAAPTLDGAPRATHYGPPAIQLFRKAGILAEIRRDGYMPERICWRKLNGERICGYDRSLMHDNGLDGDGLTVYWVGRLCALLERELKSRSGISVQWGSKVVALKSGLASTDVEATVVAETSDGSTITHTADYVIGCDGGNSTVRRLMFGPRNFPGHSWDVQVMATNTMYDFDQFGWEDTQFVIHPEHWYMAARIGAHPDPKQNIWRISYGELPGLSAEELMARQEMKFEKMLPGHPKPEQYKVLNKSPYRVHQRCVDKMRMARVLLAADAAHLCNPFGGLGLTGGIVDKWHELINPISTANIRRLFQQDPEKVLEEDEYMRLVKQAETDLELSRELQNASNELLYDYTQHYHRPRPQARGVPEIAKL
ncbi:hypothetical protein LTR85_002696 [Meristemomyces frigidus]|nr:hypothetical protein LTR85_002696 [Meristemomyces frigidus]